MGAAFVALLLIAGEPAFQASAVTESRPGESPLLLHGLGVQLSATSESRAGQAPIVAGGIPKAFVAEILIPRLGLELHHRDSTLQLFYAVRFYWEDPNPDSTLTTQLLSRDPVTKIPSLTRTTRLELAPLVLHMVGIDLDVRLSRRASLTAAATGSIGSPDYTTLPQLLGTVQGVLPPIVSLASVGGDALGRYAASRRWELSLAGHLAYWQWLDAPSNPTGSSATGQTVVNGQVFVTGQTLASVTPEATFLLTPRDWLGLGTTFGTASYSDGAGVSTITTALTWKRRVDERTNLRLTGGATYAQALGVTPSGNMPLLGSGGSAVAPIGSFELYSDLMRRDQLLLQGDATGAVDFYVDPILGSAISRAVVGSRVTLISAPRWMTSLQGDFATALRRTPYQASLNGMPVAIPPDETAFSLTLSVRRWMSENLLAEVGGRWADRGPALVTPDFQFHQRQLWIYVALTATTRPIARLAH